MSENNKRIFLGMSTGAKIGRRVGSKTGKVIKLFLPPGVPQIVCEISVTLCGSLIGAGAGFLAADKINSIKGG